MRPTVSAATLVLLAGLAHADGDVSIFLDAEGNLRVIGDQLANELVISEKGEFLIRGVGTTINGGTEPFHVPPVDGRFRIALGPGDDRVDLVDARFPRASEIDAGSGDDVIFWTNGISGVCAIRLGAGDDLLDMDGCSFAALKVLGGPGADRVVYGFGSVRGAFFLQLGAGADSARLLDGFFEGRVSLHGGGGIDELRDEDSVYLAGPPRIRGFELEVQDLDAGEWGERVRP